MDPWWIDTGADIGGQTGSGIDSGNFDYGSSFNPVVPPSSSGGYGLDQNSYDFGSSYNPTPTPSSTYDTSYGGYSYTPLNYNFGAGSPGAGSPGAGTSAGNTFGTATQGQGSFGGVTAGGGGFGQGSFATTPVTGNAGVTGSFGLDSADYQSTYNTPEMMGPLAQQPSMLARVGDTVAGGFKAVGDYARQNPWAARFAVDAAGLGLGYLNQRNANKLAQEQLQMQRETQARNNAIADRLNAESTRSLNEARSLYNPQEMGIRAMATEQGNRQTAMNDAAAQMRRRGMSQAAIDAELRRARIGGSTGAATAYTKGLDVGRTAQQSALTSAKGLSQQYGGTPNYSGAEMASKAGAMNTAQMQNLLNTYLYDPVGRTNAQVIDEQQRRVGNPS